MRAVDSMLYNAQLNPSELHLVTQGMSDGEKSRFFAGYDADAAACVKAECESCGHVGMQYEAYRGMLPKSYRAFAVCSACGFRTEF